MIWTLKQLSTEAQAVRAMRQAGGKARVLAHLAQAGYPVPDAFVIMPEAFAGDELRADAWQQAVLQAMALRGGNEGKPLAVRSSALAEDSAVASFAGEFETVLNVEGDAALRQAIEAVYHSRDSERVAAYTRAQRVAEELEPEDGKASSVQIEGHAMAVIVQEMVPSRLAGVLFTADPLDGSRARMTGNFVRGLGEKLVSGQVDGESFTLAWAAGAYDGPPDLRPFARKLFRLGKRLAQELGGPQDIEWAIAGGKLWLLQSRPITTMQQYYPRTGIWNDSHSGDYLWSNANFGEALPDVMTPLTWSLVRIFIDETFDNPLPSADRLMGNVGGRLYVNLTLFASMMTALGFSRERMNRESEEFFGNLPEDVAIPMIPFERLAVLRGFVPFALRAVRRRRRNLRQLSAFTAAMPSEVARLQAAIEASGSTDQLLAVWQEQFEPLLRRTYQMLQAGTSRYENSYRPLRRTLAGQVGEEDANLLLSSVSVDGEQLASLGPLLGLWQVAQGEMSREAYLKAYGHRGPHEYELSWPRPAEDPQWLERQMVTLTEVDVPGMLARRRAQKEAAWQRYARRFPKQMARTKRKLEAAATAARGREAIRSETTRLLAAARTFALRAGELSGLGDGVFFLWLPELLDLLVGAHGANQKREALSHIHVRRAAHEHLSRLPPYPALINGRFDPVAWAGNAGRRTDIFDAHANGSRPVKAENVVLGLPASTGVVEGVVRHLHSVDQGYLLQVGEILVAVTTNVGWTPLFPRAAAVVTDVGAPLSHAAIVARELGIPAVVGTGDATARLRDGDRVRVDGGRGVVEWVCGVEV